MFHKLLMKHLPENPFFQRHLQDIPTFLDTWLADATDHVNIMFICLPGINGAKWPEDVTKVFNQNYQGRGDEPWRDYAFLRIQGCTFSGDPYTTVRNTMASDCYGIYYRFKNGEHTPWESHNTA